MLVKFFNIFSKVVYTFFYIIIFLFLFLFFANLGIDEQFMRTLAIISVMTLIITAITCVINFIIIMRELFKYFKIRTILKRVGIGLGIAAIILVILSLIKNQTFFSDDSIFILISSPILAILSLVKMQRNK